MLSKEEILEVKQEYIDLLKQIKRPDCDIDGFIDYLESTDFFSAPASTQYHCSFPGGLCLHSINVYKALKSLTDKFASKIDNKTKEVSPIYSNDSILIVGLLHDLDKIMKYERTTRNEKVYCEDGDKQDSLGVFKWNSVESYKLKDPTNRANLGNKGFAAYMIASMFFSMSEEEVYALMYQYSATNQEQLTDLSTILARYNLCVFLHSADIIATYCVEK